MESGSPDSLTVAPLASLEAKRNELLGQGVDEGREALRG